MKWALLTAILIFSVSMVFADIMLLNDNGFLLVFLAPVVSGVIIFGIQRAQKRLLDRLDDLEEQLDELKERLESGMASAPDAPAAREDGAASAREVPPCERS